MASLKYELIGKKKKKKLFCVITREPNQWLWGKYDTISNNSLHNLQQYTNNTPDQWTSRQRVPQKPRLKKKTVDSSCSNPSAHSLAHSFCSTTTQSTVYTLTPRACSQRTAWGRIPATSRRQSAVQSGGVTTRLRESWCSRRLWTKWVLDARDMRQHKWEARVEMGNTHCHDVGVRELQYIPARLWSRTCCRRVRGARAQGDRWLPLKIG